MFGPLKSTNRSCESGCVPTSTKAHFVCHVTNSDLSNPPQISIRLMTGSYSPTLLKPPSTQAVEKALKILLESVEEESRVKPGDDPGPALDFPDANRQILQRQREALEIASSALYHEARVKVAHLARKHNTLIPVNKLPFELTTDILLRSLTPEDHEDLRRLYDLSLVQVAWWSMIKSHPPFWTVIHDGDDEAVKRKLENSGTLPLDILCGDQLDRHELVHYLSLLQSHKKRFRSFTYTYDNTDPVRVFLEAHTPLLESLVVRPAYEAVGEPLRIFGGPRLSYIRLERATLLWHRSLKLAQLSTLIMSSCSIPSISLETFFNVLGACSQLEHLELQSVKVDILDDIPQMTEPLFLARMRSLTIIETDSDIAGPLISLLHADNLGSFKLQKTGFRPPAHINSIKPALLDSSSPPPCLTSLLANPGLRVRHLNIKLHRYMLNINGNFSDEKGEISICLEQATTQWLQELGQMPHPALFSCGVPLHVEILDSNDDNSWNTAGITVNLAPFTTMTSLYLSCSPRVALPVVGALCKSAGVPGSWSCPKLAELHLGIGDRAEWDEEDWVWDAVIEVLNSINAERNSMEAREAGVVFLALYQYEDVGASRIVEDIGALFPHEETDWEDGSAPGMD